MFRDSCVGGFMLRTRHQTVNGVTFRRHRVTLIKGTLYPGVGTAFPYTVPPFLPLRNPGHTEPIGIIACAIPLASFNSAQLHISPVQTWAGQRRLAKPERQMHRVKRPRPTSSDKAQPTTLPGRAGPPPVLIMVSYCHLGICAGPRCQ